MTATCVGANVGQVMDCLVAKQVGLVAHKAQKGKPAEFWLLGSSVGSCQAVTVAQAAKLPIQAIVDTKQIGRAFPRTSYASTMLFNNSFNNPSVIYL